MVLDKVQNPSRNFSAAKNTRLDLVGVVPWVGANQPKIQHREPMRNCLPQNAVVKDVQSRGGHSLRKGIGEIGIVNSAEGKGQFKREQSSQHSAVVLMEFGS